jgi:hypothetical protein
MLFHRELRANRTGIGTVFAMVFFLLIVMLVFASFMIVLNQNTGLEQTVAQNRRIDEERANEQLTITTQLSIPLFTSISSNELTVNCLLNNTGTLPIQIIRLWVEDLNNSATGSQVISSALKNLPQGQAEYYTGSINLLIGYPTSDSFRIWFETARGNQFTLQPSIGSQSLTDFNFNKQLSGVFGDFLPDYNSVQWSFVTTASGLSTAGPWQSGWIIPTGSNNQNVAFRLNMTYYGDSTIKIDNDTILWFQNVQDTSVVLENVDNSLYPTLYISNYNSTTNVLSSYNGQELTIQPSSNPVPVTVYFSTVQSFGIDSSSGNMYNWKIYPVGQPSPKGYPISSLTPNAQMSLVLYGMSPSTYAQTFSLFAVQSRPIMITVNPTSGLVGSSVTVAGAGFAANSAISLTFDSAHVTIPTTTANANGAFTTTFTVPQATAGGHTVIATDNAINHNAAATSFTVMPSLSSPNPLQGPPGTLVTASGTGYAANVALQVTLGGTVQPTSPSTIFTNSFGSFSGSFTVSTLSSGSQTIIVSDINGNNANKTFTVTVPSISASPSSVTVGTSITITGSNFLPSTQLSVSYDNVLVTAATSTSGGALPSGLTITIPSSAYGSHTVKVIDSYGNLATSTISVSPSININPNNGAVGTSVVVNGSGFATSSVVTLTFAGSAVATTPSPVMTDSLGAFSASFTIPSGSSTGSIAGAKTVTALDAGSHIGSTTFIITPAIVLNPTSSTVGAAVTVSGTGYSASKTITIKYDGYNQTTAPSLVTTTAYGTFSCTFTVPSSTTGSHTVLAIDSSTNNASTTFAVTPSITLNPSSITPGSTLTISGNGYAGSKATTATYDGATVTLGGSTTTNGTGSFSATFTIPSSAKGSHSLIITDSNANTASASLTVAQGISLTPSSGYVGSTAAIYGGGFPPSSTVLVSYNSVIQTTTPATITTNASGSFTATIVIPPSASASNVIQASEGTNIATASFTLVVNITITSNPTGSGYATVDSNIVVTPASFNWSLGSSHTLQANSPVSGGTGIQYAYATWNDSGSQTHTYVVPSSPTTVTANYQTQYQLTLATNFGTTTPSAGNIWYNAGTILTITATPPSAGAGERFVWNGWTGTGLGSYTGQNNPATNLVTMNSAIIETASWTHQYLVTFAQSGLSADATGTVITVAGSSKTYNDLPYTVWADASTGSVTYSYGATVTSSVTGKQYVKTSTDASPITGLSGPLTVTGAYKTQWQVTFAQSGLDSSATGTVLTLGTSTYTYSQLPQNNIWVDTGTTYSYSASVQAGTGKTFGFTTVTGLSSPITTTGTVTGKYGSLILRPNAAGTTTGLSVNAGSNYAAVSETSSDGDTSYVYTTSTTSGANAPRDTYSVPSTTLSGFTIQSITVHIVAKDQSNTYGGYARPYLRIGSTGYYPSSYNALTTSYVEYTNTWATNPNTSAAWTWANINSLEIGVQMYSASYSYYARCTQVWVEITYAP